MPGHRVLTKQEFLKLVKSGIKRVESDNRYGLINDKKQNGNPATYALGAYQFVPFHHWNDIVNFANTNPKFKHLGLKRLSIYKDANAVKEYQKFLSNGALQDAFMDHYASGKYEKAKSLFNQFGKAYNLRMDEIYSMMHHQGDRGAKDALVSGKVNYKSPDGTGGDVYMKKYNRGVNDAFGVSKDKQGNYVGNKSQRNEFLYDRAAGGKTYSDPTKVKINQTKGNASYTEYKNWFKNANSKLAKGEITSEQYNLELNNLQKKFSKNGTLNDVNKNISNENRILKQKKWLQAQNAQSAINIFNKSSFQTNLKDDKNKLTGPVVVPTKKLTAEDLKYIKDHPELFEKEMRKGDNFFGKEEFYKIKDVYALSNQIGKSVKEFSGKDFKPIYKKGDELFLSRQLKIDDSGNPWYSPGTWINGVVPGADMKGNLTHFIKGIEYDSSKIGTGLPFLYGESSEESIQPLMNEDNYPINDDSSYAVPNQTTPKGIEAPLPDNNTAEAIYARIEYDREKDLADKQDEETDLNNLALDNIWNSPVASGYDPGYSPDQYKNDVPLKDLANSLGGILVGQDMADTKIPERDEKVSAAYQSYVSEMAEISKRGLSVEDEAAAKQKIAESYSLGVQALERASGGNRNIVLGNLGGLDAQRSQSLLNLSVEDAKMKMQGLQAYGEGVKYINEFDANRDIANNEREYQITQERRRNGNDLTAAAWTNFSQTMSNYDNNKPGSVNHAMKTTYLRNAFGYDPSLKDDGTGATKYTWSWLQKENEKKALLSSQNEALRSRMGSMNEDELNVLGKHLRQTASSDLDASVRLADYLISNRNKEGFDIKSINDPLAYYNNVFKTESPNQDFSSPVDVNTYTEGIQKSSSEFFKENPSSWENIYDKNSYHFDVNKGIPNFTETKKGIDFDSILNIANGLTTPKYNV